MAFRSNKPIKNKKTQFYYSYSLDDSTGFGTSDCKILIFSSNSFLKSRATLRTVGLGTPKSSTTLV